MANWIRTGILYGLMALVIGTILAALRAMVFLPVFGEAIGMPLEFGLAALASVGSGLWLMRRRGGWTTNSALYFGGLGAIVYAAAGLPINLLALGAMLSALFNTASLTHGAIFPRGPHHHGARPGARDPAGLGARPVTGHSARIAENWRIACIRSYCHFTLSRMSGRGGNPENGRAGSGGEEGWIASSRRCSQ